MSAHSDKIDIGGYDSDLGLLWSRTGRKPSVGFAKRVTASLAFYAADVRRYL